MAQTETWTDTGIAELILLLREEAASGMESIVGLVDTDTCVAAAASTFADPAEAATHAVANGLELAAIDTVGGDTVNTAGDTITFDHVFTATGAINIVGIHVCNNDDDVAFIECCFNALLAMANTDTLTIDGQSTIDQA